MRLGRAALARGACAGAPASIPGHEVAAWWWGGPPAQGWRVGDRLALAPDVHCGICYYCQRGRYNLCDNLRLVGITPEYPGGFAQMMALPGSVLRDGIVHPIPAGLDFVGAALAEPLSSVLAAHDKVATGLGDTVVVIGAGPIGCLLVPPSAGRAGRGSSFRSAAPPAAIWWRALGRT